MTHLRIEQNNIQENVSGAVIEKLYQLAISGDLDQSSNLAGNIHTTATCQEYIDAITGEFPELTISSDNIYIMFVDPEVKRVMATQFGDGTNVSASDLVGVTTLPQQLFQNNSNISTFNELKNLRGITTIGSNCFAGSTIQSIALDNITSIGERVFRGCSSLGSGQTLELNLTNQTNYPNNALLGTAFTRLILHSPQQSSSYDTRYPLYEDMRQLTYLDLSDWRPGKSAQNNTQYKDCQFYNNTSLVTYIAPITTNYIGIAIKDIGKYANARYFILLNTTPPSINTTDSNNPPGEWFYNTNGNVHIYVPDSAVSAYLNDSAWSTIGGYNGSDTISDRLHGLSELPAGVWTTGLASQYLTTAQLATS